MRIPQVVRISACDVCPKLPSTVANYKFMMRVQGALHRIKAGELGTLPVGQVHKAESWLQSLTVTMDNMN